MAAKRPVRRFPLICLTALLVLASWPVFAQPPQQAPLQERMSYAQFKRLGLDKLSPEQLKALNAWLRTHGEQGPSMDRAPARTAAQPAARKTKQTDGKDIHSHIVGTFRGWDSDTVFTLANGQRWQVADDSEMMMHSLDNPKVTLRKGFFGSWLLSVDGTHQSVRVTPAK
jgi:hypothetical protein